MAMPKARSIHKVGPGDDDHAVMVTVSDPESDVQYQIGLIDLSGAELMRACAFIGVTGDTRQLSTEQRREAIRNQIHGSRGREDDMPNSDMPNNAMPNSVIDSVVIESPVVPAPITVTPPKAGDITSIVGALVEAMAPTIDVDGLSATITENVLHAIDTQWREVEERMKEIETTPRRVVIVRPECDKELPAIHHSALPEVIQVIAAGVAPFLSGPAGTGKSTILQQAADALGFDFYPMSCDPSMMRSALFGFIDANGVYHSTPFRDAFERGGLFMLDEIDNGHPSISAGLNQALSNGHCAFPDGIVKRHESFYYSATANTWGLGATAEYVGRNPIDRATKNRFQGNFYIDYDLNLERSAAMAYATTETESALTAWVDYVQHVRRNVNAQGVKMLVTPRSTIDGAKLIASGFTRTRTAELTLFAEISDDVKARVA